MTEPTDAEVVATMLIYGGSFITRLAACWQAADAVNRARIYAAFSDYFEEYRRIAIGRSVQA